MRLLGITHRLVCEAPQALCDSVRQQLASIDWSSSQYDRHELKLDAGRLIEMPYSLNKNPMDKEDPLFVTTQALVDWINHQDGLSEFEPVRGEIAAIDPGTMIEMHRDRRWQHSNARRMHVPLITNDQCWHIGNLNRDQASAITRLYRMRADWLYELNNIDWHQAGNNGTEHRVHLIVDFMPAGFLAERIAAGADPHERVPPLSWPEWLPGE